MTYIMTKREEKLVKILLTIINDYENPKPETADYVLRYSLGSKLKTALIAAGYELKEDADYDGNNPASK